MGWIQSVRPGGMLVWGGSRVLDQDACWYGVDPEC